MKIKIEESWKEKLSDFFNTEIFKNLTDFVRGEYQKKTVYPAPKNIFNAFQLTPFEKIKVVILGQDPYHNPSQAHGLCFSVPEKVKSPPSLQNIYKEIFSDLGHSAKILEKNNNSGNLEFWAEQGVLLLNSTLTVQKNSPASHTGKGWEEFTDFVIKKISDEKENVVFLLWGNYAKNKGKIIDRKKHLVLESSHPSPFSVHNGFFGNKHFSKTNNFLKEKGLKEIIW